MAMFLFSSDATSAQVGDVLTVTLGIDPMSDSLNAVEGTVSYSSSVLSLEQIRTPDPFISMWAEGPREETPGSVVFSGIAPGGFGQSLLSGGDAHFVPLFTMDFRVIAEGDALFSLANGTALLNDGLGTSAEVYVATGKVPVQGTRADGEEAYAFSDQDPPLSFQPLVTRDASFSSSAWRILFSTSDVQSGVSYYEIRSWWFLPFSRAESPYTIPFFPAPSYTVRAVDYVGNSTYAEPVAPPLSAYLFSWGILFVTLFLFLMCGGIIWKFRRRLGARFRKSLR